MYRCRTGDILTDFGICTGYSISRHEFAPEMPQGKFGFRNLTHPKFDFGGCTSLNFAEERAGCLIPRFGLRTLRTCRVVRYKRWDENLVEGNTR